MKLLKAVCFAVLGAASLFAQAQPGSSADNSGKISERIAALQSAMAEQQKQIEELKQELRQQKTTPQVVNALLNTIGKIDTPTSQSDADKPKSSPLSVRIGGTEFTPGGFVDFNNIFRSTNTGSIVSTNWSTIPFSNSANGHLTEFRSTGQYSRWNLKVTGKYGENDLTGLIEGDFNGNDANNVFVVTNPHTFRLRLYYLQLKRHTWEFTAGQAWSLLTPNKVGASATPGDLDTTMSTDGNIHVGVMYLRTSQFRVGVKPTDHLAWALSVENPQQITTGQVCNRLLFGQDLLQQFPQFGDIPLPLGDLIQRIVQRLLRCGTKGPQKGFVSGDDAETGVQHEQRLPNSVDFRSCSLADLITSISCITRTTPSILSSWVL